ncbi:MAG: RHS repeat protein, partial [Parachlamydiaceae bacterium]|nr:RHS repeat protein [Parachlamydiaceae bacterium]
MIQLIIFLVLMPLLLFAETSISTESEILESAHTPLTTLYGAPEINIFGVNVINGDYNYACNDFDLPGSDPLIFQRTYCSSQNRLKAFFHGWSHNLASCAKTYGLEKNLHVILSGSLSGEIPFRTEIDNRHEDLKINRDIFKKGVTNSGKGHISGRTNVKNMRVKYSGIGIKVVNPDGTEHLHRREIYRTAQPEYYSENQLIETLKPNGLKIAYDSAGLITNKVKSLTHKNGTSNQITFNCPKYHEILSKKRLKEAHFSISGLSDDGKIAKYTFNCRKKAVRLRDHQKREGFIISMSAFESSHLPSESYDYMDRDDGHEILIGREGAHHKTTIDYYKRGDTIDLMNGKSEEISPSHIARNRVRKISVAINNSKDLRPLRHFVYHKDKESKDAFTDVYDNKQHLTRFHYSTKNYRLNCVEKYEGTSTYSVYRRDRMRYGAKLTPLEGDLLFKTIENADGTVHLGENFEYDERGNVLKRKQHFRTFTDSKNHSISTKENSISRGNDCLKGGEIKSTTYTYNDLNLVTSEDDGKLKTFLTYHERNGKLSNLLKSKLIHKSQKIKKREFYEFDGNAGCTLIIKDDGVTNSLENLLGVTQRKITRLINRKGSFAGLPLEIDAWGSNGQEEKRISRTILEYDSHGYVEKEIYYDSNNQFAYLTQKVRDFKGNITCETDPLGQTTHRKFNEYGSLKEVQGPSLEYKMEYQYDWLQHPIEEIRKCTDGIHLTTSRKFDLEGRLTKITDSYGFETKFIYNEQGRPTEIIYPPVRTESGNWVRPREFKQYNFLGHLVSETDAKGAVTVYLPNDAGLPLKILYADGTYEEFRYSIYGEILEKIQRNGSKVVYAYDDLSRLTSEKTYDLDGKLLKKCSKKYLGLSLYSETDGEGLTKKYVYDYAGRVSEVNQGNALTKYLYDPLGRLEEERRYFGESENDYIAKKFKYDLLNRVVITKEVDANGQTHSKNVTSYDCDGNVATTTTKTHAGTATSINKYDARGNLRSSKDPLGNQTHYIHRYDFFFEGINLPCLELIDPAGVKTTTISDSSGAVISTKVHSPLGKLLSHTEMFYDLKRNLTRKEQHLPNETIVNLFEYDSCSRLTKQVNGYGTSEQITTTFIYNSFGELSETQYSDGTSKHRTYDGLGRLFEEWSDDKSIHYEYTYNRQDLPTEVKNFNTKKATIRKYSREGNLLSEHFENGLKIAYRYDRINRIVECSYPDGSSVKQIYNPVFLTKVERIKDGSVIYCSTFNEFDQAGKPKNIVFPKNSGRLSLKYDRLNRTTTLSYPHYKERDISYDKRGLLTSKIVNNDLQSYDHDHLQQLILEKTAQYFHCYENDFLHRQISVDGVAQVHNAVHQLTHGIHEEYKYDAKGRRVKDS